MVGQVVRAENVTVDYARLLGFGEVVGAGGEDGVAVVSAAIAAEDAYEAVGGWEVSYWGESFGGGGVGGVG